MKILVVVGFALLGVVVKAQFNWTPLAPLPMPMANHAVCAAEVNGNWQVYAFGGITSGLTLNDIHRQAFRYEVALDLWSALPDIPDTLGKIAASASVVGDTAYVIGGYHVFNGSPFELSSNKVHRLDLVTNMWMTDGAAVPVPIDDQVQAVWRDSLIYVITGWSNTTNVANVQVYDPAFNSWQAATPVPNDNQYKAFGANGVIIGDTIYYHGGATSSGNFPAQDRVRIGVIDPTDPLSIDWLPPVVGGLGARYRPGAAVLGAKPTWIGGSTTSYNYNAVAYNGSGGVSPVTGIQQWSAGSMSTIGSTPTHVMDLRGLGELGGDQFILAGGIGLQQTVLDSVWLVNYTPTAIGDTDALPHSLVHPNPAYDVIRIDPEGSAPTPYSMTDATGRVVQMGHLVGAFVDVRALANGMYTLRLELSGRIRTARFVKRTGP